MFKSMPMHIFSIAFLCVGKTYDTVKEVGLEKQRTQNSQYQLIAGRLNSRKFLNTAVSQKYWNEAVTVIKTHNGGNRSNIPIQNYI